MKYFLEMVETARLNGITRYTGSMDFHDFDQAKKGDPIYDVFWDNVGECRPFVFIDNEKTPTSKLDGSTATKDIDFPFKAHSLECLGRELVGLLDVSIETSMFCAILIEKGPKDVFVYQYLKLQNGTRAVLFSSAMTVIIQDYLSRLSRYEIGTEDVRVRFKSGSGKDKKTSTIRRIVYVKPKRFTEKDPTEGRDIDWSHRWQVRGHWRTIQGLGKDRDGDYKVHNHTWVTDHERGPEDAPLVKKTRVVKGDQNGVQVQR